MVFDIAGQLVEVPASSIRELIKWCREQGTEEAWAVAAALEEHLPEEES